MALVGSRLHSLMILGKKLNVILFLLFVFVCFLQPCGHVLEKAFLCVMFSCVFVTFPYGDFIDF